MTSLLLKQAFDKYYTFPIEFWDSISYLGEVFVCDREIILKESHKKENYLYLIMEGSGGILLWNKSNFVCTDMVLERDFLCDYLSLITRKATPYEVRTFEKSKLFRISYSALNEFLLINDYGDKFWRYATNALYVDKHLQYIQTFTSTASDIYTLFQKYQPEIIKRIPLKYIASYLGITPQSLSRIRKELIQ